MVCGRERPRKGLGSQWKTGSLRGAERRGGGLGRCWSELESNATDEYE